MAGVIDTLRITDTLRRRSTDLAIPFEGHAPLVSLDPPEATDVSAAAGRRATISRPDGTAVAWPVAGAEVRHGVLALYFAGLMPAAVPRLSQVTWSIQDRPAAHSDLRPNVSLERPLIPRRT